MRSSFNLSNDLVLWLFMLTELSYHLSSVPADGFVRRKGGGREGRTRRRKRHSKREVAGCLAEGFVVVK